MFFANLTISGRIGSIEKTSISGKKTLSRPKKRFHDTFFDKSRHTPPYFFQSGTRFRPKKTKNRLLNIPPLPFFFRSKVRCRSRSIWKKISKTTFLTFFLGSIGNPFFQKSRGQKFKKMTWPPFRFFDQTPKTSNFGNSVFSGPDPFFWQFEVFDQIPEILEIRIPKTRNPDPKNSIPKLGIPIPNLGNPEIPKPDPKNSIPSIGSWLKFLTCSSKFGTEQQKNFTHRSFFRNRQHESSKSRIRVPIFPILVHFFRDPNPKNQRTSDKTHVLPILS